MSSGGEAPIQAVGRRKTSVARIFVRPGAGRWKINGRSAEDYFPRATHRARIADPLTVAASDGRFDIEARVRGGGLTGQADAIRMGVARALLLHDEELRRPLREAGMLTRDSREVERKKPGRPKARKRFQFSKR